VDTDHRLTFPGHVVEDDDSSAKYDISSGTLSISLTKVNLGEHFPDLDLTNRLLARKGEVVDEKGKAQGPPGIQVLDDKPSDDDDPWEAGAFDEALEFDFQIPQSLPQEPEATTGAKYGFNNQYSGHFQYLQNEDILTVVDGENKSALERWELMREQEDQKFDKQWYLADCYEPPDELEEIMNFSLPSHLNDPLTTEEQASLRNLGGRDCMSLFSIANEVLIENLKDIYLNLPPLLFAIIYDTVTTLSSPTPESPWTISRLTPSLAPLAPVYLTPSSLPFSLHPPLKQIKIALFRRLLAYPLYRTPSLAEKIWRETIRCIRMGKRAVIRLLLSARTTFMDGSDWSLYLKVIWEDYIIWSQGSKDSVLQVLGDEMEKITVESDEIGFDLEDLERE